MNSSGIMQKELEICCGDIGSAIAALRGGATRVELCSGLADGGLTPSAGFIRHAAESGLTLVNVLIRPRPGDFLYDASEASVLETDVAEAVKAGAGGVVIGALTPDGDIDMELCRRLVDRARASASRHINVTFHRAFDLARDPERSLEDIIELGCDCLLTSGMAATAAEGVDTLRRLVTQGGDRIRIMAGGGITPDNAAGILRATGVRAIHATARSRRDSAMLFRREGVPMGAAGSDEYGIRSTDAGIVARLAEITRKFNEITH